MNKKESVRKEKMARLENQIEKQQVVIHGAEKEIYENISQCLCLVRLQLGALNFDNKEKTVAIIGEANLLIGKAVKDLRNLARQLISTHTNYQ